MTAVWDRFDASGLELAVKDPEIPSPGELLGESQMFLDALAATRRFLRRKSPIILLQGEPGTGRTLFARRIHHEGPAPEDPFIAIQCASLPPSLLEVELFGTTADVLSGTERTRGILEVAGRGTVFLDEVQDLPMPVRHRLVELLRGIDGEEPIHCRIVAASRAKPDPGVSEDPLATQFDQMLLENMVELPPLRSRERDLELLSRHFLRRWAREHNAVVPVLESGALEALYAYPWPGNVRELATVLERAASLAPGRRIGPEHLRIKARRNEPLEGNAPPAADMILIPADGKKLADIEAEAVLAALRLTSWNRSAAARMLGISRPTLSRKIKKYRLHAEEKGRP
jgi:DNA-binding NtrC family response regulator